MSVSAAPSAEKTSAVEDFFDIFFAPAAVYDRRRNTSAWLPFLVVTIAMALAYLATSDAMQPIMDAEYQRGMKAALEGQSKFTPEQLEQGRGMAEGFAKFAFLVGMPLSILFTGIALLLTSKLVDAQVKLGTAVMIASWAFVPRIIGSIVNAVQLRLMQPDSLDGMYRLALGPARFMDPDTASPILLAMAGRFDVFILWTTVLLGIGLSVVARIPRTQGMIAAFAVWVLAALPTLYSALGQG